MGIIDKIIGTYSEREVKKVRPVLERVLGYDDEYSAYTEEELKGKTEEFRKRCSEGESLDDLLPEAFAAVREAAKRVLGLKAYPVQIIGGILIHQGRIAEMKTGEGKTLVGVFPVYLNAIGGKGVHVITVNEYLAQRDSKIMGEVYKYMGLSVGIVTQKCHPIERKIAYDRDITYATNNEIGFDYLRDNMVKDSRQKVQRGFNFVIIDEVDSVLIDEARTPLIISGEGDDVAAGYEQAHIFAKKLKGLRVVEVKKGEEPDLEGYDFLVEEKQKQVTLTDTGVEKAEKHYNIENLGDAENVEIQHYIDKALKANNLFKKDYDYVVEEGEVMIVDEHTGRVMEGRRYSEGLHQAIEVKEGVEVKKESKTLATVTYQNLFRKYSKLSGMTGTAMTEVAEFKKIYNVDVVEVPTNKPIRREDKTDLVFGTREGKIKAITEKVKGLQEKGQPVLVGTASVEASEELSTAFRKNGIKHEVLNAKHHLREAEIIAQAGRYKAVTIATNMAGRGTDIIVGGNAEEMAKHELRTRGYEEATIVLAMTKGEVTEEEDRELIEGLRKEYDAVLQAKEREIAADREAYAKENGLDEDAEDVKDFGGLYVIGTERHSSRRIDNQLRGRSGRQGARGESVFMISFEDDLMRLFGADRMQQMFRKLNIPEDVPIDSGMVGRSIEKAQKKIEGNHFGMRKHVLEYDDVMNKQREVIYDTRDRILEKQDFEEDLKEMFATYIEEKVKGCVANTKKMTVGEQEMLQEELAFLGEILPKYSEDELFDNTPQMYIDTVIGEINKIYTELGETTTKDFVSGYEKRLLLFLLDTGWQEHITMMDDLKQGVGIRAMSQIDPLLAYKQEGYDLFQALMMYIKEEALKKFLELHREFVLGETVETVAEAV